MREDLNVVPAIPRCPTEGTVLLHAAAVSVAGARERHGVVHRFEVGTAAAEWAATGRVAVLSRVECADERAAKSNVLSRRRIDGCRAASVGAQIAHRLCVRPI